MALPKRTLMAVIAILTLGTASLFAVFNVGTLVAVTAVVGFLILLPLVAVLGSRLPGVEATGSEPDPERDRQPTDAATPIEQLRERYARGEMSESEFERRLERLIETEDLTDTTGSRDRERESV